jgi:rubredoxin
MRQQASPRKACRRHPLADVPINWTCPECGARKEDFEMVEI